MESYLLSKFPVFSFKVFYLNTFYSISKYEEQVTSQYDDLGMRCERDAFDTLFDHAPEKLAVVKKVTTSLSVCIHPNFNLISLNNSPSSRLSTSTWINWTSKWPIWVPISKMVFICAYWWDSSVVSLSRYTNSIWHQRILSKWFIMLPSPSSWCKIVVCQSPKHVPKTSSTWIWSRLFVFCTTYSRNTEI